MLTLSMLNDLEKKYQQEKNKYSFDKDHTTNKLTK